MPLTGRAERRARRWYNREVRAYALRNRELQRMAEAGEIDPFSLGDREAPETAHEVRVWVWPFDARECAKGRGERRAWAARRHVVRGAFGIDSFHMVF